MVTWGDQVSGGDSRRVSEQLFDVCRVAATSCAFAALRADGQAMGLKSS